MKKLGMIGVLSAVLTLTACTASQVETIAQLIGIAVNAMPGVVSLLTSNPQAVSAAKTAQSDYQLAQTLISGYRANAASAMTVAQHISALLADANANLNAIVSAVPTSDRNRQKLSALASVLIGVGQDIIADLPSTHATVAHVKLPKPDVVRGQINQILSE